MPSIKISELNEKTILGINDIIPIVDVTNNETKKITGANLLKNQCSTSEIKTNQKWINGKPIYRKTTFISALPTTTSGVSATGGYETGITNVDQVINMYGQYQGSSIGTGNQKVTRPLNFNYPLSETSIISTFFNIDTGYIRITVLDNLSYLSGYVTLEYTKTTD